MLMMDWLGAQQGGGSYVEMLVDMTTLANNARGPETAQP